MVNICCHGVIYNLSLSEHEFFTADNQHMITIVAVIIVPMLIYIYIFNLTVSGLYHVVIYIQIHYIIVCLTTRGLPIYSVDKHLIYTLHCS
ncbi:hypothetical protein BDB01DRAFT_774390 [Pilobolus umbonatus]|nr:hypothetical protein BDB01DRAFT_774390 [Pilobolus umbonatus]